MDLLVTERLLLRQWAEAAAVAVLSVLEILETASEK